MRVANYLGEQGEISNQDGLLLPGASEFLRQTPMKNFTMCLPTGYPTAVLT
jgi:hypothetical protein